MSENEPLKVSRERVPGFGTPKVRDDLERNAEYQRRRTWSKDDRAFDARDRVARNIKEQADRDGKNTTMADALRKATEIANKQYRKDQEEGKR